MVEAVFPHLAYSHSRGVVTSALQAINTVPEPTVDEPAPINTLIELGRVHKACMLENVTLKLLFNDTAVTNPQDETHNEALVSPSEQYSPVIPRSTICATTEFPLGQSAKIEGVTSQKNWKIVKEVISHAVSSLEGLFSGIIGRPPPRRTPDAGHKRECLSVAQNLATVMSSYLVELGSCKVLSSRSS